VAELYFQVREQINATIMCRDGNIYSSSHKLRCDKSLASFSDKRRHERESNRALRFLSTHRYVAARVERFPAANTKRICIIGLVTEERKYAILAARKLAYLGDLADRPRPARETIIRDADSKAEMIPRKIDSVYSKAT